VARKKKPKPADEPPADEAPGWHALDAALLRLYPGQDSPPHFAPTLPPMLSGDGLINGISAYRAEDPAHWHLVTYGFSELYAKESDDPDVSGWGFELTMRLPRPEGEAQPATYAVNFLFNLGRYVRRSRNPLGPGHAMDLNGPICLGAETALRAAAFTTDPQLGQIRTPNGAVRFIQVVGVTLDEYHACGDWQASAVLEILSESEPLLITDLARRCVFEDPAAVARLQQGIDRDGSASACDFVSVVDWSIDERTNSAAATLGAKGVQGLLRKLRSRLLHRREFSLIGREKAVSLVPVEGGAGWGVDEEDDRALALRLTPDVVRAMMQTLQPRRGTYAWPELPGFTLTVVPSEITDSDGKVTEVIG
jgi:hypothetical protein